MQFPASDQFHFIWKLLKQLESYFKECNFVIRNNEMDLGQVSETDGNKLAAVPFSVHEPTQVQVDV